MRYLLVCLMLFVLISGCSNSVNPVGPEYVSRTVTPKWEFIPLDNPDVLLSGEKAGLDGSELVLGFSSSNESRAYPVRMMWFHHIANDTVEGIPLLVTY